MIRHILRNILRSVLAVAAVLLLAQCGTPLDFWSGSSGNSSSSSQGCPASPENPTLLLALLGGVVALPIGMRGLRKRK
jgi:hypothetical protein